MKNYYVEAYKRALDTSEGKAAEATGEQLNEAFLNIVSGPIYSVWQQVASDLPSGERMSYAGAIEVCLDADRLWVQHYVGTTQRCSLRLRCGRRLILMAMKKSCAFSRAGSS